jgi:hypothetical protein
MYADVYNQVGTPGSTPGANAGANRTSSLAPPIFLNAGALLSECACPKDENRRIVLNPAAMASSANGLSGLLNDQQLIGEQYRRGVLGYALGFEFAEDQNINLLTTGNRATGTTANYAVAGANQTGANLAVTGFPANVANCFTVGEVFTVANVYAVNPENQQSTGFLQNFVITGKRCPYHDGLGERRQRRIGQLPHQPRLPSGRLHLCDCGS